MATDANKTIKQGDSNITSAVREFWMADLKKKTYAKSLPRGMIDIVVKYIIEHGQGKSNTFNWTIEDGITSVGDDIFDVANNQLEMNQVEYAVSEDSVSAEHKAGYVAQKVDILKDQEGFIVPSILDSLAKRMAIIESKIFMNKADTAVEVGVSAGIARTAVLTVSAGDLKATTITNSDAAIDAADLTAGQKTDAKAAATAQYIEATTTQAEINAAAEAAAIAVASDISLVEMRKGVTAMENLEEETVVMLMSPNTVQTYADEMLPANTIGDNDFLRRNAVGMLFGSMVVKSTYVPDNQVFYFGEEAMIMYERDPYTLTSARDNISDLYVKFAIETRFGIGVYDANRLRKQTFSGN